MGAGGPYVCEPSCLSLRSLQNRDGAGSDGAVVRLAEMEGLNYGALIQASSQTSYEGPGLTTTHCTVQRPTTECDELA